MTENNVRSEINKPSRTVHNTIQVTQSIKFPQVVTSRLCGKGNVFVVYVCVCVSVLAFEAIDIETSFLVWRCILTIYRSSLSIKIIG